MGLLGEYLHDKRVSEQNDKRLAIDKQQTDTAQAFASLQILQHYRDRLDELHQKSIELTGSIPPMMSAAQVAAQQLSLAEKKPNNDAEIARKQFEYEQVASQLKAAQEGQQYIRQREEALRTDMDQIGTFLKRRGIFQEAFGAKQDLQQLLQPTQQQGASQQVPSRVGAPQNNDEESQPSGSLMNGPPAGSSPAAQAAGTPGQPQQSKVDPNFMLKEAQAISPKAVQEDSGVVIHASDAQEAAQLRQRVEERQASEGVGLNINVIDDVQAATEKAKKDALQQHSDAHATEVAAQTAIPLLRGIGIDASTDRDGNFLGFVPTPQAAPGTNPQAEALAYEQLAESTRKAPPLAAVVVRDVSPVMAASMEALTRDNPNGANSLEVFQRPDGKPEYVRNLFGANAAAAEKLSYAADVISTKAGQTGTTRTLPLIRDPDPATAVRQFEAWQKKSIATDDLADRPDRPQTQLPSGRKVATTQGQAMHEDAKKLVAYIVESTGGKLTEPESARLLSAIRGDHLLPWEITGLKIYSQDLAPLVNAVVPKYRAALAKELGIK